MALAEKSRSIDLSSRIPILAAETSARSQEVTSIGISVAMEVNAQSVIL